MLSFIKYLLGVKSRRFKKDDKVLILSVNSLNEKHQKLFGHGDYTIVNEECFLNKNGTVMYKDKYGIAVITDDGYQDVFQEDELAKIVYDF